MKKIELHKVTWLSRILALILFVALPFIGFLSGIAYQKLLDTPRTPTETNTPQTQNEQKPPLLSSRKIYTNDNYGFTFSYPASLTLETSFQSYYHLPSLWRSGATPGTSGVSIISIPSFRIKQDNAYPRYFSAEVRIGASSDPRDIADCYKNDGSSAGIPATTEIINGTEFMKFTLGSAGMMQYMTGVSYRTIHNNTCFAIEQIQAGSTYRDDETTNTNDISDEELDSYYNSLADIVQTFRFTK